ncbi:MAG TPA: histidine--tRNA ligase [Abditibacterium sp.]|jgi:histidyl-tRNA synthetase
MSQPTKFQSPRGTYDILPENIADWRFVEETFRAICGKYGFQEIRTPLFEHTELFARATGESSDVMVTKQMYSFVAADEQNYTLRPEGTAGVVRAYLEHNLKERGPVSKLFYIASVFRYEAVQAGRQRQHHQCGIEMLGASGPEADAEVLALSHDFLQALNIAPQLRLNSLGTSESRRGYIALLRAHLEPQRDGLSDDSKRRFEVNPLRIFDSKDPRDHQALEGAPRLLDYLRENDAESLQHFETLCKTLDELGISYEIDHNLVRGFDYYSRTAFEWVSDKLGAQSTVLGGGRYDGLVEELGGPATPGIGFGSGIERLLLVRAASNAPAVEPKPLTAFLVTLGDAAREAGAKILAQLRAADIACDRDFVGRSMRAQMREANRQQARFTLIVGEDELAAGTVSLKNMESGTQETLPLAQAIEMLKRG